MAQKQTLSERIADRHNEVAEDIAERVAELQRPVPGNVHVGPDERRRRFWQVDPKWPSGPEEARVHELRLQGFDQDGVPLLDEQGKPLGGLTPQDVGLLKYPYREIDARAFGGPDDDKGQVRYMVQMAEQGPPEPEPLEVTAREIEERNRPQPEPQAPGMAEVFASMPVEMPGMMGGS